MKGPPNSDRVAQLKELPHPLERAGFFSLLTISWVGEYIKVARLRLFEQSMHPRLSKIDTTAHNFNRLSAHKQKNKTSLIRSVIAVFGGYFLLLCSTTLLRCGLNGGVNMMMFYIGSELEGQAQAFQQVREWKNLAVFVSALVLFTLCEMVLCNLADVERIRLSLRVQGSLSTILFKKIERIGLIDPNYNDEGSLTNNFQIDCERVCDSVHAMDWLMYNVCNFLFTAAVGAYLFQPIFLTVVISISVAGAPLAYICWYWWKVENRWMTAKDNRLSTWKHLFSIIKFLKVMGWENAAYNKIELVRRKEVRLQFQNFFVFSIFIFFIVAAPAVGTVGFLKFYFSQGYSLDIARATIFIRLVLEVGEMVFGFPACLTFINELIISLNRLNRVLETPDLDSLEITNKSPMKSQENAVEIPHGIFYWRKRVKKDEDGEIIDDSVEEDKAGDNLLPGLNQSSKSSSTKNSVISANPINPSLLEPLNDKDATKIEASPSQKSFEITIKDFCVPKGKVTFIIGKIGSGKSSLLYAILGEMSVSDKTSQLNIDGKIGYIGQKPWILNTTVKKNILMDKPEDPQKLAWALKYSAFEDDVKTFENGFDKETGENGDALSGGQRARLALAQTLYQDPDIFIFDDILSALDSNVGSFIMEQTILEQLRGKTVLMTTHAVQYLSKGDYVHLMEDGKIEISGTFEDISHCDMYVRYLELNQQLKDKNATPAAPAPAADSDSEEPAELQLAKVESKRSATGEAVDSSMQETDPVLQALMVPEDREKGTVSLQTFLTFFRLFGGPIGLGTVIVVCIFEQLLVSYKYFTVTQWSENFETTPVNEALWKYFYLSAASALLETFVKLLLSCFSYYLSRGIHARMVYSILHSKVESFLGRVPTGRILNRFSKDLETVDQTLYWSVEYLWYLISKVLVQVFLYGFLLGKSMLVAVLLMSIVSVYLQRIYMGAKREFIRLYSISKSPMLNVFLDLCKGLPNIRCLGKSKWIRNEFMSKYDDCISNAIVKEGLNMWYILRSSVIVMFMVVVPSYLVIMFGLDKLVLSEVMLTILIGTSMGHDVKDLLYQYGSLESSMVSLERCHHFEKMEPEEQYKSYKTDLKKADGSDASFRYLKGSQEANLQCVVTEAHLRFTNVSCKYAVSTKPVLHRVSFEIMPGQKVGVIGRTGSGKSTLIKLLWRILDFYEGEVLIDGKSLKDVDLKSLRSQIMIVNQEVALLEGTLRENIDIRLQDDSKDVQLKEILDKLGFSNAQYLKDGLAMHIDNEGSNLSAGEKQLVSFARTLMDKKKFIILDEATANIDLKTEQKIQECIDAEFKDSTMLVIAHRLQTIMNCDKILVLDHGQVLAFDSPANLLKSSDSYFAKLVEKMKDQHQ